MLLIIGYGNPLRGDDGAGFMLAGELSGRLSSVRIIQTHQLLPELAVDISDPAVDRVLFIDVRRGQQQPLEFTPVVPAGDGSCGHQLSPALLLYLARTLFGKTIDAELLTLPACDLSFGSCFSPTTQAALAQALDQLPSLLNEKATATSPAWRDRQTPP